MKCLRKFFIQIKQNKPDFKTIMFFSIGVLLIAIVLSICIGSVNISLKDITEALILRENSKTYRIIAHVRFPRTVAALLSGSALAVSGAVIQSVLENPLAGPNIIGVNSGAGFAVILFYAFFPDYFYLSPFAAFLGALFTVLFVYLLSSRTGAGRATLILAGVAVSSLLSAGIDTIVTFFPEALTGTTSFRIGSIAGATIDSIRLPGIIILLAILLTISLSNEMDVLSLGETTAKSLGLNTKLYKFIFLVSGAALAGASVSFAGLLGFIGLIIPHAARFFTGNESKKLLPLSAIMGATFACICDTLARVIFAPYELPLGIIMSFLGVPFFIWLLLGRKRRREDA